MHKTDPKILNISIDTSLSILDALKKMDEVEKKLLLVFNKDKFFGLVSIGDIQRAIINNINLSEDVSSILRKDITLASYEDDLGAVKKKMFDLRIECMPILDKEGNLKNVLFWEDLYQEFDKKPGDQLDIPVVIMAGGRGERLKPITNVIPKPLIPVGEKPIIETIINQFHGIGAKNFYVTVNYKYELIEYYFNTLKDKQSYHIEFILEDKPLGTAGSLKLLENKISNSFFVSNCDIIIDQDFREVYAYHKENKNELTLVASMKHYKIPYGTINSGKNGKLLSLTEKPELTYKINTGVYILEPHLLEEIPENISFHITHLIDKVIARNGKVGVFPVSEKSWMDIGEWSEYHKTTQIFEKRFNTPS